MVIICYSHSSYSDLWDMFFGQIDKYVPGTKKYLFTDSVNRDISDDINVIQYDDADSYSNRVASCLKSVEENTCLFHHEDMILYDKPDIDKLNEMVNFVSEYNIDYIKLLKGGHENDIQLEDMPIKNLYWIPHSSEKLSFAIQPTIWKTKKLLEVYEYATPSELVGNVAVGNFEINASDYVNDSDINGLYWFSGEDKRGKHHWDSSVYPHGNMIFKGKWVYSEYGDELNYLHKNYEIDKNIRGTM